MATTPLTVVEGATALPRSRPFSDVPAPFGRGWTLRAPGYCLDGRLHGLYGAILKRFDLDEQPIRSFCRWVAPENPRPLAAAAFGAAVASGAGIGRSASAPEAKASEFAYDGASAGVASSAAAHPLTLTEPSPWPEAPVSPKVLAPVKAHASEAARQASRATLVPWWILAGGACALGGAALLAWMPPRHDGIAHPDSAKDTKSVEAAVAVRNTVAAQAPLRGSVGGSKKRDEAAHAKPTSAASVMQLANGAPTLDLGSGSGSGSGSAMMLSKAAPRRETAQPTVPQVAAVAPAVAPPVARVMHPGKEVVARNDDRRRDLQRHVARAAAPSHPRYTASDASGPVAPSPVSPRFVKPSVAGSYSPLAPSPLGTDDYASVDIRAHALASGGAQQSQEAQRSQQWQPPSSPNASADNGQQWINRLSQRRVTEVPDQFIR
ncbi:hypothetical protein [Paraburkholderia phenoliruptrix]|nr:hypothetical protein [Paraburkholderia phenoliruptrix]